MQAPIRTPPQRTQGGVAGFENQPVCTNHVALEEVDVEALPEARTEMMARSGRRTVPQIFIGEVHVGGADELHALDAAGRLDPLLNTGAT